MAGVAGSMESRRRSLDGCADGWKTVEIERLRFDGGKAVKFIYSFEAHKDGKGLTWREVPAPAPQPGRPPLLDATSLIDFAYKKSMEAPRAPAASAADVAAAPAAATPDAAPAAASASDPAADEAQVKSPPAGRPPRPPMATAKDSKANAFPIWAVAPAARLLKAALSAPAAAADGRCSHPAAPDGGAATSAARDTASPATTSLAAGAPTPRAPDAAADGCSSRPAAPAGGAATSAARDAASPATTSMAAGVATPPGPTAAADGRCSRPVAPAGGAATSAARDAASPATTSLAAGAVTPTAPAADAGSTSGGSGFAPHVREKLQQLLHAAPAVAATAAPGARPETAAAAPGSGTGTATEVHRSKLRAEAPPFVPRAALAKPSGGLRAGAPVFVPQASTVPAALSGGKLCAAAPTC